MNQTKRLRAAKEIPLHRDIALLRVAGSFRLRKEVKTMFEVIDVECAFVFYAETAASRDAFKDAVELVGHRCIVREVKR